MLLSKYDSLFKEHIDKSIQKSEKAKNKQFKVKVERTGGLVTFLSKTTADYIIETIGLLMKRSITDKMKEAKFFTIQIDSTQDINVHDQLSIIVCCYGKCE